MHSSKSILRLLRYPGGKQRQLLGFIDHLPKKDAVPGKYVEPFVGGAAVFFALEPKRAILSDKNKELIELYSAIRSNPDGVWHEFRRLPSSRRAYYKIRDEQRPEPTTLVERAARTLYLNRTCFKGMWRYNAEGRFNVGYGGLDRYWSISKSALQEVSSLLSNTHLKNRDFEEIIDSCEEGDFIFVDPPYRPGHREMHHRHYLYSNFDYSEQQRLAASLDRATGRNVRWAMTNSSHVDIVSLYQRYVGFPLRQSTGGSPGILSSKGEEILIINYHYAGIY